MIAPFHSGGILLSYKCDSQCRHCLYACGPRWRRWLSLEDARLILDGIRQTSQDIGVSIHLAGGEPFLDFQRLLAVQRIAVEHCVPVEYVETNAGWCMEEPDALEKFTLLKDSGLDAVLISSSPFHAEHIPVKRILTAIKAGLRVFGPDGVLVWIPQFLRQLVSIDTENAVPFARYVESVGMETLGGMLAENYSIVGGGRAGTGIGDLFRRYPPEHFLQLNCRRELLQSGHAHFDPWGNLIPSFCAGISLGDARSLPELMRNVDFTRTPIVAALAEEGLSGLYRIARRDYGYDPEPDGYMDKCHLCASMRRCVALQTTRFPELAPKEFYERVANDK